MPYNYQIVYDERQVIETGEKNFDSEEEAKEFALTRIDILADETNKHYEKFDYELEKI